MLSKTQLFCFCSALAVSTACLEAENPTSIMEVIKSVGSVEKSRDLSLDSGYFIIVPKDGAGRISLFFKKYPEPAACESVYREIAGGASQGVREPPFQVGEKMTWALVGSTWSMVAKFDDTVLAINGVDGVSPEIGKLLAISLSRVFTSEEWRKKR